MAPGSPPGSPARAAARWLLRGLLALLVLAVAAAAAAWWAVRASLPQLDGEIDLPGLAAPLSIQRDALGTAVLQGADRLDLARGLGFLHAQERFFEMDLTRRSAAGELSALFGPVALERDKLRRPHRLRARLEQRLAQLPAGEQALLQAYTAGVNAGLAQLTVRPWAYLLLRAEPQPWVATDSLLVIAEMYWMLQGSGLEAGLDRALLREKAGDALYAWLDPAGGRWDAALDGSATPPAAMPGPALLDLRARPAGAASSGAAPHGTAPRPVTLSAGWVAAAAAPPAPATLNEPAVIGSNNWAVAGRRTATGGAAMLADDMHLGLSVPGIWYRAQLEWVHDAKALRVAGVSLPGLPAIVAGSNGSLAWGFTNAYGQWFDWIRLPAGATTQHRTEQLQVKGGDPVNLDVEEFEGAPVVARRDGVAYAVRWVAHQGEAFNLALDEMLQARSVAEGVAIAQRAGMPHQNILLADRAGHIAWTIAGRLWAGRDPAQDHARFQPAGRPMPGWLPAADYPLIQDPEDGQLWTANNRQLSATGGGRTIGDGGFDLGARAQQIRDRLSATARFDEARLGAIHFDNEARLMQSWARRIRNAVEGSAAQAPVLQVLAGWNGRADADQTGYRLVRAVRLKTLDTLWAAWTGPLAVTQPTAAAKPIAWRGMFEYPATQALDEQPAHLLPPGFADWPALLRAQVDAAVKELTDGGRRPLAEATWGPANASRIQHVLSRAIPALSRWLDMPSLPQSGDSHMPHVAQPTHGQSQRLVVSPGREEQATLAMPGGQSGHPMSPFYGAGHEDWVAGRPTPLLAGEAEHRMMASPGQGL